MTIPTLIGYSDRLSAAPGDTIRFMVSATTGVPYEARLVRIRCGDPNPHGPGYREDEIPSAADGTYESRFQETALGSHAVVPGAAAVLAGLAGFRVAVTCWPTLPGDGRQALVSQWDAASGAGFALAIEGDDGACLTIGDGSGRQYRVATGEALRGRAWCRIEAGFDPGQGRIWVRRRLLRPAALERDIVSAEAAAGGFRAAARPVLIAAQEAAPGGRAAAHFNGKLEAPEIAAVAADGSERLVARWDFAQDIPSTRIVDAGPHGLHGELVNMPARAMRGAAWSGRAMRWGEAPEEYAAIHFHDDDIYDCGWAADFSWTVPAGFPSGAYAMRLRSAGSEDHLVFFVRPERGKPRAKLAFLVPTFTYTAYCNFASPRLDPRTLERIPLWNAYRWHPFDVTLFGRSTYNHHRDGSGISYSSRLRPNMNLRPKFLYTVDPKGSGLRHFPADTYITAWFEHLGEEYDVITDEDLHEEGLELLAPYRCLVTSTHPEYHTTGTLDAIEAYVAGGGRLMYLGGNGFYWKIAVSPALPGAIELRRGEGGIRLWAAEPGEYYHAFDGQYGGLWRRNGRPPNRLCGVGFSAQGNFDSSYYRRQPGSFDPRARFIFEGIAESGTIGDFGFFGGGAAGFELDRADTLLETPPHALVLASSEGHGELFRHVNEEMLGHLSHRKPEEVIRADMVFFEAPKGGAVFSVGSINFCGSLPYNGYRNDIATIATNVLRRFLDPGSFQEGE